MDAPKSTITVKDDARVLAQIRESVMVAVAFASDNAPEPQILLGAVDSVLEEDTRFSEWPMTNVRGGQSTYLMDLHEAVMKRLERPVTQDAEVAESYVAAQPLPEVDQATALVGPGEIVAEDE